MAVTLSDMDDICDAGQARAIRPISTADVHRICSGQVVLSLATAIKELVENSLDAGSTSIEICLKEYGLESIVVNDNGCGVEEVNFQALTLKHHTSKLTNFEDLSNVSTFGFRGEALSSLCALSNLSIVTCHRDASVATKLEFDHNGKIIKKTACSRQVGTTVTVQYLFSTLPVRHKEFTKNIKKEFAKMLTILYGYCIISTSTRISCINQIGKNKNVIVATQSHNSLKENICNIFGPKQLSTLTEIQQCPISQSILDEYCLSDKCIGYSLLNISGYMSNCQHGLGRSSADRQFAFINGRPCDLTKVFKVMNEVYHMYNRHQYPFILLNITLNKDSVDINVTPDKRLLFIEHEKILLATVKSSLISMYEPLSSIVHSSQLSSIKSVPNTENHKVINGKAPFSNGNASPTLSSSPLVNLKRSFSFLNQCETGKTDKNLPSVHAKKQPRVDSFFFRNTREKTPPLIFNYCGEPSEVNVESSPVSCCTNLNDERKNSNMQVQLTFEEMHNLTATELEKSIINLKCSSSSEDNCSLDISVDANVESSSEVSSFFSDDCYNISSNSETITSEKIINLKSPVVFETLPTSLTGVQKEEHVLDDSYCFNSQNKVVSLNFSMNELKKKLEKKKEHVAHEFVRKFRAKIEPSENASAEEELTKAISKDAFSKMDIIGQFNLGFIIAKLESDLFIIDQHASDEKFNFEILQKNTVMETQKLIRPQSLHLTAVNETILIEHHETFRKNGFIFEINEEAQPGHRIKLIAVPVSKNWHFGKEDIEEMLFMLSDADQGVMCRPSRIRQMFASRACRKSVMIGMALNKSDMKKIVSHMGSMDHPWNCPHGRPTMRHLINLNMISTKSLTSSPMQNISKNFATPDV